MQHKYPFAVLQIEMNGNELDVNVHPSKLEVRFSRGEDVYQAVCTAVRETLSQRELIPEVSLGEKKKRRPSVPSEKKENIPEPFEERRRSQIQSQPYDRRPVSYGQIAPQPAQGQVIRETSRMQPEGTPQRIPEQKMGAALGPRIQEQKEQIEQIEVIEKMPERPADPDDPDGDAGVSDGEQMGLFNEKLLTEEARQQHILIGQLFKTYWLVEYGERFFIIDQHATHEKVLYEKLRRELCEKKTASQYLEPPLVFTVDIKEELLLLEHMRMFQKLGFEIEPFGPREYSVHAVPTDLYGMTGEGMFKELLDSLEKENVGQDLEIFTDRLATMACKAAVKGNHALSRQEVEQLIDELLTLENPYHCPHGRPTIISMSKTEIERKFKRII